MKEGPCANSALKVVLGPYSPTSKFEQHMKHEKLTFNKIMYGLEILSWVDDTGTEMCAK